MSSKEKEFQDHICKYLEDTHNYTRQPKSKLKDTKYHFIDEDIIEFIKSTQEENYNQLKDILRSDTDNTIIKELKKETHKKPLWVIIKNNFEVKGIHFSLYEPKPRSNKSEQSNKNYEKNILSFKDEYYYNPKTKERIDLVIWLNGLPIIVIELKHEDEGQNVDDAIYHSFLNRDLSNNIFKFPFVYIAMSNQEVKIATNLKSDKSFMWFNQSSFNEDEKNPDTLYPSSHLYIDALSKDSIVSYLSTFLINVENEYTIFPRYHQIRANKKIANEIKEYFDKNRKLGKKYLINHSAGSGKTLTISWMADILDSLYSNNNEKIFDNIIIITDRKSLDKNVKDDLINFSHLEKKLSFCKNSKDLAKYLTKDKSIIITTIHKFGYIKELIQSDELKNRKVAFLIDEAHRSQDGNMALNVLDTFTSNEIDRTDKIDDFGKEVDKLDITNQIFIAFTATTTPTSVSYFGNPFDIYSEEEAINEKYILDVASNIMSYNTLYNLKSSINLSETEYPLMIVQKYLRGIAYADDDIIKVKSKVIEKIFDEKVKNTIKGKGKAMVVASSRPAGLKYFKTLKYIIEEKKLPYKVLFAFSDYDDPDTGERIEEVKINELDTLHKGKLIEDVFELDEYRILIVANKFQTGFDQPLLSTMFLDKKVGDVNAIQTVSRLNRRHDDKTQEDILVVDFTDNTEEIFGAFNSHRQHSPYQCEEPTQDSLISIYRTIESFEVFTKNEVKLYNEAYNKAEKKNIKDDAILSNLTKKYQKKFKKILKPKDTQKKYLSKLNKFIKVYNFIAKFYVIDNELKEFLSFAKNIGFQLMKIDNSTKLSNFREFIELSKGAVTFNGNVSNNEEQLEPKSDGMGDSDREVPKSTIAIALESIREKYPISDDDAIIIKEICEEVSTEEEIQNRLIANKTDNGFIIQYKDNTIKKRINRNYLDRGRYDVLEDEIYTDIGGIISLMGQSVVDTVLYEVA